MICLSKEQCANAEALKTRRAYVAEQLETPRSAASPSSEEWVSSEFWGHHKASLRQELAEIDVALEKLARKV